MVRWNRRIGLVLCLLWAGYGYGQDTLRDAQGRLLAYTDGLQLYNAQGFQITQVLLPSDALEVRYRIALIPFGTTVSQAAFVRLRQPYGEEEAPVGVAMLRWQGDSVWVLQAERDFANQQDVFWVAERFLLLRAGLDAVVCDVAGRRFGKEINGIFAALKPEYIDVLDEESARLWAVRDSQNGKTAVFKLNHKSLRLTRLRLIDPTKLLALQKRRLPRGNSLAQLPPLDGLKAPDAELLPAQHDLPRDEHFNSVQTGIQGATDTAGRLARNINSNWADGSRRQRLKSVAKDSIRGRLGQLASQRQAKLPTDSARALKERFTDKSTSAFVTPQPSRFRAFAQGSITRPVKDKKRIPRASFPLQSGTESQATATAAEVTARTDATVMTSALPGAAPNSGAVPATNPRLAQARQWSVETVQRVRGIDKRANIWYFGKGVGLDFGGDTVRVLKDGRLDQLEGSATIADTNGKLLFYTDGRTVWNRLHRPMENGEGLLGHPSASTAALIVPAPGDEANRYYIFTAGEGGYVGTLRTGIAYSVVDIRRGGGLGAVVQKNVLLLASASERMAAVQHADGKSVWVLVQPMPSHAVHAYRLSENGIDPAPVESKALSLSIAGNQAVGVIKASPDGRRVVITNSGAWRIDLYDFDSQTGQIAGGVDLHAPLLRHAKQDAVRGPYGAAFSPDGKLLYVGGWESNSIYQFDIEQVGPDPSKYCYKLELKEDGRIGALQLANDGSLYAAFVSNDSANGRLIRIRIPNQFGLGCSLSELVASGGTVTSRLGLPHFQIT